MDMVSTRRLFHPITVPADEPLKLSITTSMPATAGYKPLALYTDDDTAVANTLLCPRYADTDPTSAPPSPASIESFDILDNVPWRRSYISLGRTSAQEAALRRRWRYDRARILAALLLSTLVAAGCTLGGILAARHLKP
ncbi:hypothetical protein NX059_005170 [Plenodomus lindquistii]|nr:hypothetical protein NX059_005170 [Plenodomus lindquistii]